MIYRIFMSCAMGAMLMPAIAASGSPASGSSRELRLKSPDGRREIMFAKSDKELTYSVSFDGNGYVLQLVERRDAEHGGTETVTYIADLKPDRIYEAGLIANMEKKLYLCVSATLRPIPKGRNGDRRIHYLCRLLLPRSLASTQETTGT